jgi:hypothetical protein
MDISIVMRMGLAALGLAAGGAFAQSRTPVQSDVGPPPAEERDSIGAVVLQNSMVRAQREALAGRYVPTRVTSVGRGVIRMTRSAHTKEELQQQREDDAIRLHEMGAGSLTAP